jgi:hypothetical protein
MIIAAVKLSDIELDVDTERPKRAKPKHYAPTTGQVKSSRVFVTFLSLASDIPLPCQLGELDGHASMILQSR